MADSQTDWCISDADALYTFKSRGFDREVGLIQQKAPLKRGLLLDGR